MRAIAAIAASLIVLLCAPDRARACSCPGGYFIPEPDTVVPRNPRFVAILFDYDGSQTLRLDGPLGPFPATLSVEEHHPRGTVLTLGLDALLDANTAYTLYYGYGTGLEIPLAFTTNDEIDQQPPPAVGLDQLDASAWRATENGAACFLAPGGWHREVAIPIAVASDDIALVRVRLFASADAAEPLDERTEPWGVTSTNELRLSDGYCVQPPPPLVPGDALCAEVVTVDVAGNTSIPSERVCTFVTDCGTTSAAETRSVCEPAVGCFECGAGDNSAGAYLVAAAYLILRRRRRG